MNIDFTGNYPYEDKTVLQLVKGNDTKSILHAIHFVVSPRATGVLYGQVYSLLWNPLTKYGPTLYYPALCLEFTNAEKAKEFTDNISLYIREVGFEPVELKCDNPYVFRHLDTGYFTKFSVGVELKGKVSVNRFYPASLQLVSGLLKKGTPLFSPTMFGTSCMLPNVCGGKHNLIRKHHGNVTVFIIPQEKGSHHVADTFDKVPVGEVCVSGTEESS